MATRKESAAATRRSLLDAASSLLDAGGPGAVTLREVGARAGISRGAPYRHFPDKESLLTSIATAGWDEVGDALEPMATNPERSSAVNLRDALLVLVAVSREHPHRYTLMFSTPTGDPTAAVRAAGRTQDLFLSLVAQLVGPEQARRYGAILLTSAHGIAGLELSGHLSVEKWHTTAENLIDDVIALLPVPGSPRSAPEAAHDR